MRLKQLTKGLQLTPEQQEKVKPILAEESKKIEGVNADTTLSMEQRFTQYDKFRDETYAKIKELLTPEQVGSVDKVRKQMEGRRSRR